MFSIEKINISSVKNPPADNQCKKCLEWTNEKCAGHLWIREGYSLPIMFGICPKCFDKFKTLPFNLQQKFLATCKRNIRRALGEKGEC